MVSVLEENGVEHHLSPRFQICPDGNAIRLSDDQAKKLVPDGTMCLKFFDTKQEKKIEAGVGWPFEKLEPYECLISSDFGLLGVKAGDKVTINLIMDEWWNLIRW